MNDGSDGGGRGARTAPREEGKGTDGLALQTEAGALAHMARAEAEVKGSIVAARQFPRQIPTVIAMINQACDMLEFAEDAAYAFARGQAQVTGPTVGFARELNRCWGNTETGIRILSKTDKQVHIMGYAVDFETNTRVTSEDKLDTVQQRKQKDGTTQWVPCDERDLREAVNRRGAICVRNSILQMLPAYLVGMAQERCRATVYMKAKQREKDETAAKDKAAKAAKEGKPTTPPPAAPTADPVKLVVAAFLEIGISDVLLEKRLGHPTRDMTLAEIADLRRIWKLIQNGDAMREEYFDLPSAEKNAPNAADESPEAEKPATQPPTTTPPAAAGAGAPPPPAEPAKPATVTPEKETSDKEDAVAAARMQAPKLTWTGKIARLKQSSKKGLDTPVWWLTAADGTTFLTMHRPFYTTAQAAQGLDTPVEVRYIETLGGNEIVEIKAAAPAPACVK